MNEKYIDAYKNKINEINVSAMVAYKEQNIYKLIDLYGSINYFNGSLMNESLNGFNEEINSLFEETLIIRRKIYSFILDIL